MSLATSNLNHITFQMEIPDEPYVDNFSQGRTHTAHYTGETFLKMAVEDSTGLIGECLWAAESRKLLEQRICHPEPGHSTLVIDARNNPWEAAYIRNTYSHDEVPNYEEDVGQVDSDGNPIIWDYSWGHVLNQIYYINDLKYINGEFVKPRFRLHQHTNEEVHRDVVKHIEMCDRELARDLVYRDNERTAIENCKAQWIVIRDNFSHVLHWKLKYPDMPLIKP